MLPQTRLHGYMGFSSGHASDASRRKRESRAAWPSVFAQQCVFLRNNVAR